MYFQVLVNPYANLVVVIYKFSTVFPEAKILDEIQTKLFRVFLLTIHSYLYSVALRFLFLQTHTTSYVFLQTLNLLGISTIQLLYTVKEKGGKPYLLPYGFRNPYRNLKSENSQVYAQKPQ